LNNRKGFQISVYNTKRTGSLPGREPSWGVSRWGEAHHRRVRGRWCLETRRRTWRHNCSPTAAHRLSPARRKLFTRY